MFKGFGFPIAMLVLGAAIWGAFFYSGAPKKKALPEDTPGPNLVIEVAASDGTPKGTLVIDLLPHVAPAHVERIVALAKSGAYDGVVFHRVIDEFMAQTGDVKFGKHGGDIGNAGRGASDMPDLKAEFSNIPFKLGTVGMARSNNPDSANSQFFIMFGPAKNLNGQYTVVGRLIDGLPTLYNIKLGDKAMNGLVSDPDYMAKVTVVDE